MSNEAERVAFKAKFRPRHDVREILERNSFTNAITEQMWWAFQAGSEWQRSQSAPAGLQLDTDTIMRLWQECGNACNDGNAVKFARAVLAAAPKSAPVVMPERKKLPELMMATYHESHGWNACLDKFESLNRSKT